MQNLDGRKGLTFLQGLSRKSGACRRPNTVEALRLPAPPYSVIGLVQKSRYFVPIFDGDNGKGAKSCTKVPWKAPLGEEDQSTSQGPSPIIDISI